MLGHRLRRWPNIKTTSDVCRDGSSESQRAVLCSIMLTCYRLMALEGGGAVVWPGREFLNNRDKGDADNKPSQGSV